MVNSKLLRHENGNNENFDNLFLAANNLEQSKKFYAEIVEPDINFDFSSRGMVAFKAGNEEAAIILKDMSTYPDKKSTIWFEVNSVETSYGN